MINRTFLQYAIKNMAKFQGTLKYRLPHIVGKLRKSSLKWYQYWPQLAPERNLSKRERDITTYIFDPSHFFCTIDRDLTQKCEMEMDLTLPFLDQFSISLGLRNLKFREEFKDGIYASIRTTFNFSTEAPNFYPWFG